MRKPFLIATMVGWLAAGQAVRAALIDDFEYGLPDRVVLSPLAGHGWTMIMGGVQDLASIPGTSTPNGTRWAMNQVPFISVAAALPAAVNGTLPGFSLEADFFHWGNIRGGRDATTLSLASGEAAQPKTGPEFGVMRNPFVLEDDFRFFIQPAGGQLRFSQNPYTTFNNLSWVRVRLVVNPNGFEGDGAGFLMIGPAFQDELMVPVEGLQSIPLGFKAGPSALPAEWNLVRMELGEGCGMDNISATGSPLVRLVAIEVTQSIQDWNNSVPLVTGKRTFARVFLEAGNSASLSRPVTGKLHGRQGNGSPLPGSPIFPSSSGGLLNPVLLSADAHADRSNAVFNLGASLTFDLPPAWTTGAVCLRFEVEGLPLESQEPAGAGNIASNGVVCVSFQPVAKPKIVVVPMGLVDPSGPVTVTPPSPPQCVNLVQFMRHMYPVADVDWEMRAPVFKTGNTNSLTKFHLIDELKLARQFDGVTDPAVFYCGMVVNHILTVSTLGRAGDGVLWTRLFPETTLPHELGHLLDRSHAVHSAFGLDPSSGLKQGNCGERASPGTLDFPFFDFVGVAPTTLNSPLITHPTLADPNAWAYGFTRYLGVCTVKVPTNSFELMSYCEETNETWVSTFTYSALRNKITSLYPLTPPVPPPGGGVQAASSPNVLIVRGVHSFSDETVEWLPFQCRTSVSPVPAPQPGDFLLRLKDGSGGLLSELPFQINLAHDDELETRASFLVSLAFDPAARRVELWRNSTLIGARDASPNPPVAQLLAPAAGQVITTPEFTIQWQAGDADGDNLSFSVQHSADDGLTWQTLGVDLAGTNLLVRCEDLAGGSLARVRVLASDGFHCVSAESAGAFTLPDQGPLIFVAEPADGQRYFASEPVRGDATAIDRKEGRINGPGIEWHSDRDGLIGTGEALHLPAHELSAGEHQLTVIARDSLGHVTAVTNRITIIGLLPQALRIRHGESNDTAILEILNTPNSRVVLEVSSNLVDWVASREFIRAGYSFEISEPVLSGAGARFFRVRAEGVPVTITTQPVADVLIQGASLYPASVSVNASGTALRYQWYRDGVAVSGATASSLSLSNLNDSGSYECVIANFVGAVTSAPALVTILSAEHEVIHHFGTNALDGINGWGPLFRASDGWLYGCTRNGAISNSGVAFKLQLNGANYTVLRRFQPAADGGNPSGGLIEGSDGLLYGTCQLGGTNNSGTLWRMNKDGSGFTVLRHLLSFGDCRNPQSPLIEASDGMLYGTAYNGGGSGRGGVFRLNKDGTGYQIISGFNFAGTAAPLGPLSGVIEAADGLLYGATEFGGSSNRGAIYRLSRDGVTQSLLASLGAVAGGAAHPDGMLLQASDDFFYGTTYSGGASNLGAIFRLNTNGAFSSILQSLGDMAGDAVEPRAGLVELPSGRLAGTTRIGGSGNQGTIFILQTNGTSFFVRHSFTGTAGNGARPRSPLLITPGGVIYGMTFGGGTNDQGVVFRQYLP